MGKYSVGSIPHMDEAAAKQAATELRRICNAQTDKIKRLQAAVKPFAQAFREGPRDQPWIETVNMTNYRDWKRAAEAGVE